MLRTGADSSAWSRSLRWSSQPQKGNAKKPERSLREQFKSFTLSCAIRASRSLHSWGRALNESGEHIRANEKLDAAIVTTGDAALASDGSIASKRPERQHPRPYHRRESAERPTMAQNEAVFRREGDYWTVTYEGKTSRLKDAKGFPYIAHLLAHSGEEIGALDLSLAS